MSLCEFLTFHKARAIIIYDPLQAIQRAQTHTHTHIHVFSAAAQRNAPCNRVYVLAAAAAALNVLTIILPAIYFMRKVFIFI